MEDLELKPGNKHASRKQTLPAFWACSFQSQLYNVSVCNLLNYVAETHSFVREGDVYSILGICVGLMHTYTFGLLKKT